MTITSDARTRARRLTALLAAAVVAASAVLVAAPAQAARYEPEVVGTIAGYSGSGPSANTISADGERLYVANYYSSTVTVVDLTTQSAVAEVPSGLMPMGVAVTPDGSRVYTANFGGSSVSVIDADSNTSLGTVSGFTGTPPRGIAMSPDGTRVYTANGNNSVSIIDTASNAQIGTVSGFSGSVPWGVAVSPDGHRIYTANLLSGDVSVIDATTHTQIARIATGSEPYRVAVSPDNSRVYVTNSGSNTVSVIDAVSLTKVADIDTGRTPYGVTAIGESRIAVANRSESTVSVIDVDDPTVRTTLSVGSSPYEVSLAPDAKTLYVGSMGSSSVSIISLVPRPAITPATQAYLLTAGTKLTASWSFTATGFASDVTYSVSPALPAGLSLDADTGVISGTPTTSQASTTYTVTGTDGSATATATVTISIAAALTPAARAASGSVGSALTVAAPTAVGFASTPTFTVAPTLPEGLTLGADGSISGTPVSGQDAVTYTITANGGGATASTTVTLRIAEVTTDAAAIDAVWGEAITPTDAIDTVGFGDGTTFTVSPALPEGLTLDSATGVISGTVRDTARTGAVHTLTGTDDDGATATTTVTIDVAPVVTAKDRRVQGTVGAAFSPTRAATASGFPGAVVFETIPALPGGLSLDTATGVISGTPTAAFDARTFRLVASGSGFTASVDVTIAVAGLTPAVQTVAATRGEALSPTVALTPTGFGGAVSYAITPALPDGLVIDAATGVISGTPTGDAEAQRVYTITATGSEEGAASATVHLSVRGVAPTAPAEVTVVGGAYQAYVSWPASTDDGGAAVEYTVTAEPGGKTCTTTGTSCIITGLDAGKATFTVTASNAYDTSEGTVSAEMSVRAGIAPDEVPAATGDAAVRFLDEDGIEVDEVSPGQKLTVEATGFAPGSNVEAYAYSTPTFLGMAKTDAEGAASFAVTVPLTLAPGAHTLVAIGFGEAGATAVAAAAVSVAAAPVDEEEPGADEELAGTGGELAPVLPVALMLLLAGAAALMLSRRHAARS